MLPGGTTAEYHYVNTTGSVMVIPIDEHGKIWMVHQYRYLMGGISTEFAGGGMVSGMSIEDNARKELLEELGIKADRVETIGSFNPFKGVTDEMCNVVLARGLQHVGASPEDTEEVQPIALSRKELEQLIASNVIRDGMTLAAWQLFSYHNLAATL